MDVKTITTTPNSGNITLKDDLLIPSPHNSRRIDFKISLISRNALNTRKGATRDVSTKNRNIEAITENTEKRDMETGVNMS